MNSFDWKFLAILSGGPGVVAISLGAYVYPYQTFEYIGLWLMSIGASGVLFALLCLDSARRRTEKLGVLSIVSPMKIERSTFSTMLIGVLVVDMIWTLYLTPAMLSPPEQWCYGCNTALQITHVIFNPAGGATGSVLFALQNEGNMDVTISQVLGTGGSLSNTYGTIATVPGGTSNPCTVTGGSDFIPVGASCNLYATFASTNWTAGTIYSFTLISTHGAHFPYAQGA